MSFYELMLSVLIGTVALILAVGAILSLFDWIDHKRNLFKRRKENRYGH